VPRRGQAEHALSNPNEGEMDTLTLFGLLAVTAMLIFYSLEDRHPRFILAFAIACLAASIYGFLQGAWPFGIVEAIWACVAVYRWRTRLGAASSASSPDSLSS
jgi:hypothetical protein